MLLIAARGAASAQQVTVVPRVQSPASDLSNRRLDLGVWVGGGRDNRVGRSLTPESIALFGPDNSDAQVGVGSSFGRIGRVLSFDGDLQTGVRFDSAARRP